MNVCSSLGTLIKQAFPDNNSTSIANAYEGCTVQRHTLQDTYLDVKAREKESRPGA